MNLSPLQKKLNITNSKIKYISKNSIAIELNNKLIEEYKNTKNLKTKNVIEYLLTFEELTTKNKDIQKTSINQLIFNNRNIVRCNFNNANYEIHLINH